MKTSAFVPAFRDAAGSPIRELFPYLGRPGLISFAGGYPSPTLFDAEGLRESTQRILALGPGVLQYGATEGTPELRQSLLALSASRGIDASMDELLVTTGSQQAFDLLVRILVGPGDVVLLESPTYPAAIQTLRQAGATLMEVAMDANGLRTDDLERILDALPPSTRPKLLYTVPTFSNPRGTLLPPSRRAELVRLAIRHGFLVVEDDPYGELVFEQEQIVPLYAHGHAAAGNCNPVIYLSSLSKTVAPALRIGWMVASPEIVRRSAIAKQTVDLCTSPIAQLVADDYLRSGRHAQTVSAASAEYGRRAAAMTACLAQELGGTFRVDKPRGGMFLWAQITVPTDSKRLFQDALDRGVLYVPGTSFYACSASSSSMRLSFAATGVEQIREGSRRLAAAIGSQNANHRRD